VGALVEAAAAIPGVPQAPLADLRGKLAQHAFNLVVAGEFKRCKRSLINALLGAGLLPAFVSHPTPLRQAGRLRHDFEERIKASVRDFRRAMLDRIEATLAGIEPALGQGRALRQRGESETASRQRELAEGLGRIAVLEARSLSDL